MEDEGGVKAPVTRLRRRLSVEQSDEIKSSPAPNTPTKKRGGRRAAKPELDLIDENVPENITPKRSTKKTIAKDLEALEEKPVTPSRRSARIKSNSSIVLETTQTFDSSRAKRAARRNSQVDSDNEAPLTPARQTRRTRKNSESAEKAEPNAANKPVITEIIAEEPELPLHKPRSSPRITVAQNQSPTGLRQSPRLNQKINISTDAKELQEALSNRETSSCEDHNTSNKENETDLNEELEKNVSSHVGENIKKNDLSQSSSELLNQLKMEPKKLRIILNRSATALVDSVNFKNKRQRAKSWTTLSEPTLKESKCYSDSETAKEKSKKGLLNDSKNIDLLNTSNSSKSNLSSNKKRKSVPLDSEINIQTDKIDSSKQTEKDKFFSSSPVNPSKTKLTSSLEKKPTNTLQKTICMDDCESNIEKKTNDDDQCVPVVKPHSNSEDTAPQEDKNNFNFNENNPENMFVTKIDNNSNSCEPMDVDETLPDNMEVNNSLLATGNSSKHKGSDNKNEMIESDINETGNSRKSSLTLSTSHTLETPNNENKNAQLQENSDENIVPLLQQIPTEKMLPKSDRNLAEIKDIEIDKPNRSLNCLTSTPIQQKSSTKVGSQINTSGINSHNNSKIGKSCNNSKSNDSNSSNMSNKSLDNSTSEEEEESSAEENKFVDDEAEEASDDYESGDSKDEEEEQYERENEIVHKGETLTSEDELSNDSDYEKDSFVVSSDEEDDDLLDGSGDDLSMTDDELKMTAKSKNKYNERKIKEQKRASREMFESRHKLNASNKSNKSENSKIKKKRAILESSDSDDDDMHVKVKKNNRIRLDSSHEASFDKSLNDSANNTQKSKDLSKPAPNDSVINEVEMSIAVENTKDESDPLSVEIKKEPKTPQNGRSNLTIEYIDPKHSTENGDGNNESQANEKSFHNPMEHSNASDSSESCDNLHIQNYDSVLNDLNKSMMTKKSKDGDISLNLGKKIKEKHTVPIIDQLNLTQFKTNKLKKNQSKSSNAVKAVINKSLDEKCMKSDTKLQPESIHGDNESSASIDLNLLFSEESNSSDSTQSKVNSDDLESNGKDTFIPLKQIQGKTNILEASGIDEPLFTESAKKKNKKRKTIDKSVVDDETCDDMEVQFYIDTTGNRGSISVHGTNKEKEITEGNHKDDDVPLEVFNKDELEKRSQVNDIEEELNKTDSAVQNKSLVKTPKSDKKNKKKRISESQTIEQTADQVSAEINHISSSNSTKKQKPGTIADIEDKATNSSLIKTPVSEKKKLKKTSNAMDNMEKSLKEQNDNLGCTSNNKKKSKNKISDPPAKESDKKGTQELVTSKKRKRRSSCDQTDGEREVADVGTTIPSKTFNCVISTDNKEKKRKISHNIEDSENNSQDKIIKSPKAVNKNTNQDVKRKNRRQPLRDEIDSQNNTDVIDTVLVKTKGTKKRKEREDDEGSRIAKVPKINSFDKLLVPRLPSSVLSQLDNKPKRANPKVTKPTAISTTDFDVQENERFKLKPSKYLEESIYINKSETSDSKKHKSVTNPKVLPSLPTVLTSNSGYTTNFKVNVIPKKIEFVAKSSSVSNFKNDYLQNKKMKRLGTYELYKKQRNFKMSKF